MKLQISNLFMERKRYSKLENYVKMAIPMTLVLLGCATAERIERSQVNASESQPAQTQNYTELPKELKHVAVYSGNSLGDIAARCGVSYETAVAINGERNNIFTGDTVEMPKDAACTSIDDDRARLEACTTETVSVSFDKTSWEQVAGEVGVSVTDLAIRNRVATNTPLKPFVDVPRCDQK